MRIFLLYQIVPFPKVSPKHNLYPHERELNESIHQKVDNFIGWKYSMIDNALTSLSDFNPGTVKKCSFIVNAASDARPASSRIQLIWCRSEKFRTERIKIFYN